MTTSILRRRLAAACATTTALLLFSSPGNAQVTFSKIVDISTDVPCAIFPGQQLLQIDRAMQRNGRTIFYARLGINNVYGIFEGFDNGPPSTIVTSHPSCSTFAPTTFGNFSFDGTNVAFDQLVNGQGISLVRQTAPDTFEVLLNSFVDEMPGFAPSKLNGYFGVSIDGGDVSALAQGNSQQERGIITSNAVGVAIQHAIIGDDMPPGSASGNIFFSFGAPVRDATGVAYSGSTQFGGYTAIFKDTGAGTATIVDSTTISPNGDGTVSSIGNIVMQNGDIAFQGQMTDPQVNFINGVYSMAGGLHTVADTNTPVPNGSGGNFVQFSGSLAIHSGATVFMGSDVTTSNRGIYIENNGILSKIIAKGDILDGSTVSSLRMTNEAFDGQSVAFFVTLENPYNEAVYRADGVTLLGQPDTDGDGIKDPADNCVGLPNPEQFDYDNNGVGDECDPARFSDITTFVDVSGDMVPDVAGFVGVNNGKPSIVVYSGADGSVHSSIDYLNFKWHGFRVATAVDANQDGTADDPAIAVLAVNKTFEKIRVETRRLDNAALVSSIQFFSQNWRAVDVVVVDDLNGDGDTKDSAVAVLAERYSDGRIQLQLRDLSTGALISNTIFLNANWTPIGAAVARRIGMAPLIGVAAHNNLHGTRVLQSRVADTGALYKNTRFLGAAWDYIDVSVNHDANADGTEDDPVWMVLATRPSDDVIRIQSRFVADGLFADNISILNNLWQALHVDAAYDMGRGPAGEIVIGAIFRASETRRIHVKDYISGATTINIAP